MENFISVALVLTSSLFIMGVNVGIFKINKVDNFLIKYINKFFAYFGISQDISKYTLPILIYIAREIISKIFYKISAILAKLERPTDKEEYEQIVTKKRLTLEFVNYYFNLYYIMLYKKKKNKCENGDCFQELRKQLILILISNISSVFITFVYRIIYMNKNIKNFEIRMKKVYEKNSMVSHLSGWRTDDRTGADKGWGHLAGDAPTDSERGAAAASQQGAGQRDCCQQHRRTGEEPPERWGARHVV